MFLCYLCTHIFIIALPYGKDNGSEHEITVLSYNDKDYISLTDMANGKQSESRASWYLGDDS